MASISTKSETRSMCSCISIPTSARSSTPRVSTPPLHSPVGADLSAVSRPTHRRFEHSLGVMELAGRVFDVVTSRDNVLPEVQEATGDYPEESTGLLAERIARGRSLP